TIGPLDLPFPIAIWGLVAAFIIIILGYSKLPVNKKEKKKKGEEAEPSGWWVLLLVIGAFIVGQIIFLILPSPTFQHIEKPIRWYSLMWVGGFVFGYWIMKRMYAHAGRTQEELDKLFIYVFVATVVGAR